MARLPRIDSGENEVTRSIEISHAGEILHGHNEEIITGEAVKAAGDLEYQKLLAFMEEKVTVMVHETSDKNAEPMPAVYVNGTAQFFPRGVDVECRRKYVEGLVRAKPEAINAEYVIATVGAEPSNRVRGSSAAKYPFSLVRDDNPRGAAWLRELMAEDRTRHAGF
jgi:hypothetical protein